MRDWDLKPPPEVDLQDRQVPRLGHHLDGRRIALLITGGIAAMKAPFVARSLRRYGAEVVAFCSPEALRYVAEDALAWSTVNPVVKELTSKAEHLSDEAPFDAYLVAPATYNTINKAALGIADTPVTTALGSAIGRMERGQTSVLIAPTMHGTLHNSILTRSLKGLRDVGVRIIPPRQAYGKDNIPETEVLTAEVIRAVSNSSLRGMGVLVTGEVEEQIGDPMSESNKETTRPRVDVRIESAKAPKLEVGTVWKVVASSPASLWEGAYTVTLERIQTEENERGSSGQLRP